MVLLPLLAALCAVSLATEPLLSDEEMVKHLNLEQNLFEAGLPSLSEKDFKSRLMDVKYLEGERIYGKELEINDEIPESFDARTKWPDCESITTIRDQANCGSCWAVSAASAMSDRLCIQSGGKRKTILSDADILACCGTSCGDGCNGGNLNGSWHYATEFGVCSGGHYGQKGVCKPYPFHPCGKHENQTYYGECIDNEQTPKCRKVCQFSSSMKYEKNRDYVTDSYALPNDEAAIQKEIMKNGPVQAAFLVYPDFRFYKRGIYRHTGLIPIGAHAIKIVGWGVEDGVKYWTISNSWNSDWGENGYFRMIRGINECFIEQWVQAGMMKV